MTTKREASEGTFVKAGRAVDETAALAEAIRLGTVTRPQFDAWYAKRSVHRAGIVVSMREKAKELKAPLVAALERGAAALRRVEEPISAKPRRTRPAARPSRRK
jgi:hypothetical protein